MLKLDTSALEKQLAQLTIQISNKLENMVRAFSYNVTIQAINTTPVGDSQTNAHWYELRTTSRNWESYGLQPIEGFAQGSWQVVSSSGAVSLKKIERYGIGSDSEAEYAAKTSLSSYKLGDQVIIGNKGPYIMKLENGYSDQAPAGIMKPTMQAIQSVFQSQLKVYYDKGMI